MNKINQETQLYGSFYTFGALFMAILSIHVFLFAYINGSKLLSIVTILDAIIAIVLGVRQDNHIAHAGLIIGIVMILVSIFTFSSYIFL